ncbi:hypothetical protein J1N35_025381 [Gossypium stocksii]|uniref:Uncharacterized protein n=1 Tax=Gossypium stocksii TaxID=47602 RepID=A0A9D3ZY78_9ROSI|nr:hypothetical protein J1N35_025381 [Gossypium stocksii]
MLLLIQASPRTQIASVPMSIMPHKRARAFTQIDEIQNKFHSEEAKVRYDSIFKNQQMHPEKGFTLKESKYRDFMARIRQVAEALNWELFYEKNQQRVQETKDPKEAEDDPTEIEPEQSAKVPNEAEPMEPEAEPDIETSMFGALTPSPDLRDELSKLIDLMHHLQWQQQAY